MTDNHTETFSSTSSEGAALPDGLGGWMGFVGVLTILNGILQLISCVGIPMGILLLLAGFSIMGARAVLLPIRQVDPTLLPFFSKMKTFFVFTAWTYILVIVVFILVALFYGAAILAMLLANA